MKFWTIQSQEVLDIIEKEEVYHPQFSKSQYYKKYLNYMTLCCGRLIILINLIVRD